MLIGTIKVLHIVVCLVLIGIVLLQQGKGADMGATFGGGGNTLFGSSGADTLLTRLTTGVAVLFMLTSLVLAINARAPEPGESELLKRLEQSAPVVAPEVTKSAEPTATTTAEPVAPNGAATQAAPTASASPAGSVATTPAPTPATTPAVTPPPATTEQGNSGVAPANPAQ